MGYLYRVFGATEEDNRRAESLLADQKERAEHVMLVDLARNDLGRVSEYSSVHVCATSTAAHGTPAARELSTAPPPSEIPNAPILERATSARPASQA